MAIIGYALSQTVLKVNAKEQCHSIGGHANSIVILGGVELVFSSLLLLTLLSGDDE